MRHFQFDLWVQSCNYVCLLGWKGGAHRGWEGNRQGVWHQAMSHKVTWQHVTHTIQWVDISEVEVTILSLCRSKTYKGLSFQRGKETKHCRSRISVGWGHMNSLGCIGQHLVDSHGQARPDPSHSKIGEIIKTVVSQFLSSCLTLLLHHYVTQVECRIRIITVQQIAKIGSLWYWKLVKHLCACSFSLIQ